MTTFFRINFMPLLSVFGRLLDPKASDQPFMASGLAVADSGIHGKGLFTTRSFRRGAILGKCRTIPSLEHGLYTLTIDDNKEVDVVCDLKYINHSDQPNAVYYDDLSVVALRPIARGEEITHNYGEEWLS